MTQPISLRAKLFLIAFGLAIPLLMLEIGLEVIAKFKGGTEFNNVDDLRKAMLEDGHEEDSKGGGVSLKRIIYPHENNDIIYDLRPDLDVLFQRAHVTSNSCGMRSPERPLPKASNTFRIALLGDSFAFGWGVEQKESFAQVLENNLNSIYNGNPKIEVLNFSVPGYSTFQEVYQFLEKGADLHPDAVVVFFVQNDFGPPFFIRNIGRPGIIPSSQVAQLAINLIDPHAAENAIRDAGLDPNRSLNILADHTNEQGIPLFLAINPKKDWRNFYRQLWILKKRPEIRFMNLREDFLRITRGRNIKNEDLTLTFDPHPSALRHGIYGDIMTPYLLDVINKR